MEKQGKGRIGIALGYHFPCLDGIFSAMNCFLALKLYSEFNTDLMQRLATEDLNQSYFSSCEDQIVIENEIQDEQQNKQENNDGEDKRNEVKGSMSQKQIELKKRLSIHSDDLKGYVQSDSVNTIRFVPSSIMEDPEMYVPLSHEFKYLDLSQSILILLDYYGQTAANICALCAKYKRVIIIDHHKTFESALQEIIDTFPHSQQKRPIQHNETLTNTHSETKTHMTEIKNSSMNIQTNISTENSSSKISSDNSSSKISSENSSYQISSLILEQLKQLLPNLSVIYDSRKSGASLSLEFFSKIFGMANYLNDEVSVHLKEMCKLVEIYDTKQEKSERAEAFCANLITQRYELNAKKNPVIFSKIISSYIEGNVQLGMKILHAREKLVTELIKHKFKVIIGGKSNAYAICYAVMSQDHSIINETAHRLALISQAEGMDNLGCFIINNKKKSALKVSLRADNTPQKKLICHTVAQKFHGGGHPSASSFFTTFNQVKSWR